ncbi:YfiR family protein [Persicobacter diffluens]|uniref:DUF4154 domain-containing protein n=1 Tax=Persicobacter diffluens TaxID=981 RepID=A0AAN4VV91_9BACT|nr:hypothetical protein PEDI_01200 [Persicobacter diffluens]
MKNKILFFLWAMLLSASVTMAQGNQSFAFQKLYIYTFTKYVEWPAAVSEGDFVIGVLGQTGLLIHLQKMADEKTVDGREIKIVQLDKPEQAKDCHILFLAQNLSEQLPEVEQALNEAPVLVVTEQDGLAKEGSGINFIMVDGKLKFEMNLTSIEKSQLKVKDALKRFAVEVYS